MTEHICAYAIKDKETGVVHARSFDFTFERGNLLFTCPFSLAYSVVQFVAAATVCDIMSVTVRPAAKNPKGVAA